MAYPKKEIPIDDLINLTTVELMEKYNCSDTVVHRRRREMNAVPAKRLNPPKKIPPEVVAKMVRLYTEEKLPLYTIQIRFPGYGVRKIRDAIKEVVGDLEPNRRLEAGWCAT